MTTRTECAGDVCTHPVRTPVVALAVLAVLAFATLALVAGCSSGEGAATGPTATQATTQATTAPRVTGKVTVSAAASLTEAFRAIAAGFEHAEPGAEVAMNLGSSGQLSTQIEQGAPADVAAFADRVPMTSLSDAGLLAAPPKVFARNRLVIVTKAGNPADIAGLDDLATAGTISLCDVEAPCGRYADRILEQAEVRIPTTSVTRGVDVKSTLRAVTDGDAEAAIVYATDARAAGGAVDTVDIPAARNVVAEYPIAVVAASTERSAAAAFEDYVLGPEGQAVLRAAGFLAP